MGTTEAKKILIIEDDDLLRKAVIGHLEGNHIAYFSTNGEDALVQIKELRPDLIVLDLLLPKMDGFAVLESLRGMEDSALSHTPVIVISNLDDEEIIAKARSLHVEEYLPKSDMNFGIVSALITRILTTGPSQSW